MNFLSFRKSFLTVLICICSCFFSYGQKLYVLSAADSSALPGMHVSFHALNTNHAQNTISNHLGIIDISEMKPEFPLILEIKGMGFQRTKDTLFNDQDILFYLNPLNNSINEVVVTGQYGSGTIDKSIHVIKVLDREWIDRMAAQNLKDVLSNSLNIRMNQDNILGSGMSMQGVSGQNVKILIDGVPIIGRLNGNIDISQINMNNVERIEIVEGPLSVNYGTDALAGTINIITKKYQKNTYIISNDNYYESNGQYNMSGKVGYQKSDNTIQFTLGRNYFDGWNEGDKPFLYRKNIMADSSRFQSWKPKEQIYGSLLYSRKINDLDFYFTSDLFDENIVNLGKPRQPYGETALDDNYKTRRSSNSANINGKINDHFQTNITFSYNYYKRVKNTFFKDLTTLEGLPTSGSGDQDTTLFHAFLSRGSLTTHFNRKINFELGYDINYEINKGYQIKDKQKDIGDYAVFATAEYHPLRNFVIKPGIRAAYNTQYQAPLIPSLNFKYFIPIEESLSKKRNLTFRTSYARGFRAPSLKDLYFNFVDINHNIQGNENLNAEHSNNFIFNAIFQQMSNKSALKVEWNNFYNDIQNLMVLAQTSPNSSAYTYTNIGEYKTYGSSILAEIRFNNITFAGSTGFVAMYNQEYETNKELNKFSYTPEIGSSLFYDWKKPGLTFSIFYKYSGKVQSYILNSDQTLQQSVLQDYQMADLAITKSFLNEKVRISVGSKNLFNITNLEGNINSGAHSGNSYSSPMGMGRTYFFNTSINLNAQ